MFSAKILNTRLPYVFGDEVSFLENLGKTLSPNGRVLMLGCGPGIMAMLLAEGAGCDLDLHVVDMGDFSSFIQHMRAIGRSPGQLYPAKTDNVWAAFARESFDLLIVDADHSKEAVIRDIKHYWDHVKYGGLIFFHDFLKTHEIDSGVAEAIEQCKTTEWEEVSRPGTSIVFRKVKVGGS